jgi:hypothetical protein
MALADYVHSASVCLACGPEIWLGLNARSRLN